MSLLDRAESIRWGIEHGMFTDTERAYIEAEVDRELYRRQPDRWVSEKLGEHLWSKQTEIAYSVRDHRYTAVHSAHDTGKSYAAARIAAWWLDTHPPGEAFVVSTAPTFNQVRGILWREIGRAHRKGGLVGRVNQTEWFIGEELVGFGRKPDDYDPTAFQGIHARYVLVLIDEACGVPKALWDAADTLATNEDARVLAIGNPDDPSSHFAAVCKPGSGWNVIHIDGLKSPNFTDEDIPEHLRPLLLSPTWVEERKARWGEVSPLYIAKVRGRFPDSASDGVVPLGWARQCQGLDEDLSEGPVELGLDVGASVDGDETVIFERRGMKAGRVWRVRTDQPEEIVGETVKAVHATNATAVKVDSIGVGFGIAGWLEKKNRDRTIDCAVYRVNVAERPKDPKRFVNLRDELWWEIGRELSEAKGWDLTDLDDDALAQLVAPQYSTDSSGRIKVEPKAEVRKRLGRSPDEADALLLAFYDAKVTRRTIRFTGTT